MRIGIDIDNVISNFNEELLNEYIKHDNKIGGVGIINPNADYILRGMFSWTQEEVDKFYKENIERIAANLKPIDKSKETIDKLKSDGNQIYIITGRANGEYKDPYTLTTNWLKKYDIYYDKLIYTDAFDSEGKAVECVKNNVDVMIDDSIRILERVIDVGKIAFLMETPYSKKKQTRAIRVISWDDVYERIKEIQ